MSLMSNWEIQIEEFTMMVDNSRSLSDAIEAGNYHNVNWWDINEERYFSSRSGKPGSGKCEKTFKIFAFPEEMKSDNVICEVSKKNCRFDLLLDLFAFGEVNPDPWKQFTIVTLNDFLRREQVAGCLTSNSRLQRGITLEPYQKSWDTNCRFLSVSNLTH